MKIELEEYNEARRSEKEREAEEIQELKRKRVKYLYAWKYLVCNTWHRTLMDPSVMLLNNGQ